MYLSKPVEVNITNWAVGLGQQIFFFAKQEEALEFFKLNDPITYFNCLDPHQYVTVVTNKWTIEEGLV